MDEQSVAPLYQCSACTQYENGCSYVKDIEALMSNCPTLDLDTVKCTEYQPRREWEDLEQSLYRMAMDKSLIQYDLTEEQQVKEVDSAITWDSLEREVYRALKLGRKPVGITIGENVLPCLDPYGTLQGYKIQAISVLEHTLSVSISPYLSNGILLRYR